MWICLRNEVSCGEWELERIWGDLFFLAWVTGWMMISGIEKRNEENLEVFGRKDNEWSLTCWLWWSCFPSHRPLQQLLRTEADLWALSVLMLTRGCAHPGNPWEEGGRGWMWNASDYAGARRIGNSGEWANFRGGVNSAKTLQHSRGVQQEQRLPRESSAWNMETGFRILPLEGYWQFD